MATKPGLSIDWEQCLLKLQTRQFFINMAFAGKWEQVKVSYGRGVCVCVCDKEKFSLTIFITVVLSVPQIKFFSH